MPFATYSALTSFSSWIICVRYSLEMKGLEMPIVNFLAAGCAGWAGAVVG